jgi:hypothetical protein
MGLIQSNSSQVIRSNDVHITYSQQSLTKERRCKMPIHGMVGGIIRCYRALLRVIACYREVLIWDMRVEVQTLIQHILLDSYTQRVEVSI